jgi:hypothetical protein
MRTCKEVAARLSFGLEQPLPLGERMTLRLHMMMCRYCSRYYDQIRALRDLAQGYEATEMGPSDEDQKLSPEAQEHICQALSKAQQDTPAPE